MIINPYIIAPPVVGGGGGGGVTWNPSDKDAGVILSNGNLTAEDNGIVRATTSHSSSGKYYLEMVMDTVKLPNNRPQCGLCVSGYTGALVGYGLGHAWAIQSGNFVLITGDGSNLGPAFTAFANGDVVGIAVDFTTGKIWFAKNNSWYNSGNPGAGTNATYSNITGSPSFVLFPATYNVTGSKVTARFASSSWGYSAPSGFGEW